MCLSCIKCSIIQLYPIIFKLWAITGSVMTTKKPPWDSKHEAKTIHKIIALIGFSESTLYQAQCCKCTTGSVAKAQVLGWGRPHKLLHLDSQYLLCLACHKPTQLYLVHWTVPSQLSGDDRWGIKGWLDICTAVGMCYSRRMGRATQPFHSEETLVNGGRHGTGWGYYWFEGGWRIFP